MGRPVLEDDQVAIAADIGGERHLAAKAGEHRLPLRRGNANALAEFIGCRVATNHRALQRPCPTAQGYIGSRSNRLALAGGCGRGARRGFRATKANGLPHIHRVRRTDAVVARQLLEAPAMARGNRIQGVAALDLVAAGHDFVGGDMRTGGVGTTRRNRQHYGDQNKPQKHTTSLIPKAPLERRPL
ncbi:hypothetical protein D3C72_1695040 [compost metagenome]